MPSSSMIKINSQKAKDIARLIVQRVESNQYPFDRIEFPDAIIPEGIVEGSLDHALYLFHATNVDSSRSSEIVYSTFRSLVKKIDLKELAYIPKQELYKILKEPFKSFGHPADARDNPLEILSHNAAKLEIEYRSDPRLLIGKNVEETIDNIQYGKNKSDKFIQYREGKAKLLLKNFVRFGIWPFSKYELPIKIDRHNIRIMVGTGVVEISPDLTRGRSDKLYKLLTDTFLEITLQEKISAISLNDGVWATGRYHCKNNNAFYCENSCKLGCNSRPRLDERASYFIPRTDVRKEIGQLSLDLD